jgi:hypothetical protein
MRPIAAYILTTLIAFIWAVSAFPAHAADDPPTEFSKQVTAITGDWVAEDWREGRLVLHPKMYTWQSDQYVKLDAEEPIAGRNALAVARAVFDGFSLEDDSLDPTLVNMDGAKELVPGILAVQYRWNYAFDNNVGFFGVVTTTANSYIPFHTNCEKDDPDLPDQYRFEKCIRTTMAILLSLRGEVTTASGRLSMPSPPSPLNVPGWDMQYASDGSAIATSSNMYGTVTATIRVAPPRLIPDLQLPAAIRAMSDSLVDELHDQAKESPGKMGWVGATNDPWLRREFPKAFSGPSIHMGGSAKLPDGRTAIIGIRCPNAGWLKSCSFAVEQAKTQVKLGILETRRQKIIAATQIPLPANGLKDAQIAGIYTEGRNTMGAGGFMTGYEIDGTVLLKDGRAINDLELPPAYIDPVAAAQKDPDEWGRWTRAGNTITIRWNDNDTDTITVTGDNLMVGGTKGMRLSGEYRHVSGSGNIAFGGGNSALSQSSYTFRPDGTFESDRSSSFMVGPGIGADGASAMGGSSGGGEEGRYLVDGYTLTLTYSDGRISRLSFAAYAHEMTKLDRGLLMLNGTVYFRDDGK